MNKLDVVDFEGIDKIVIDKCNFEHPQDFIDRLKNLLYMNCKCGTITITPHSETKKIEGIMVRKRDLK